MPTRELVSRDAHRMALGADTIEYVLVRRFGRRGVGLKVDENGLVVSAPSTMPLAKIETLVRDSERWILRKIAEWSHRKIAPAQWREGERIPFLGGGLTLRLARGARSRADRKDAELWDITPNGTATEIERAVVRWYKRIAHTHLAERLQALAEAAKLALPHAHDLVGHGPMGQLQLEARGAPGLAAREGARGPGGLRDLPRARASSAHEPLGRVLDGGRVPMSRLSAAALEAERDGPPLPDFLGLSRSTP